MKLGILGAGKIVTEALPIIAAVPDIELAAIFATPRSKDKLIEMQNEYGIDKIYTDLDELLADDNIDTVYVALPNSLHFEFSKKSLLAGKNVISEKPFVPTVNELIELRSIAKERNLVLAEAITNQYLPNYQIIKDNLAKLGDIKLVIANYSQYSSRYDDFKAGKIAPAFDPNRGGGALMDLNIYNLHLIVGLFGKPQGVQYRPNIDGNVDTSGVVSLEYSKLQALAIAAKDADGDSNLVIEGTKGRLKVNGAPNTLGSVTLTMRKHDPVEIAPVDKNHRMHAEFVKFAQLIAKPDHQFIEERLDHSQHVLEVLEKARENL